MSQITHSGSQQIVTRTTLRSVLRDAGESCYCAPDQEIEWDAGKCPKHRRETRQAGRTAGGENP